MPPNPRPPGQDAHDAEVVRDAARYRFLREGPVDGTAGRPVIAVPTGATSGSYVNEADADAAVDRAMLAASERTP